MIVRDKEFIYNVDFSKESEDENEYVHAPDTSLYLGFAFGKISMEKRKKAYEQAGFKFYKIIDSNNPKLNLPKQLEIF